MDLGGAPVHPLPLPRGVSKPEQAYRAIQDMVRQAEGSDDSERVFRARQALEYLNHYTANELDKLTKKFGALDALSARAVQSVQVEARHAMHIIAMQLIPPPPPMVGPTTTEALPVTVMRLATGGATRVPVSALDPGSVGHLVQVPGAAAAHPASSLPGHSLAETAGAQARGIWRGWVDPPATVTGATAAHPAATEATVTPSRAGTSSFWLRPADPVPTPGIVPFDSGPHHAGETVRPPPVTTTANSTAPAPVAPHHVPSWVDDNYTIVRALRDAYPERAHPQWLDRVRDLLFSQGELAAPSVASDTVPAELDLTVFGRFLGAGEEVPHPAQSPPPFGCGGHRGGRGGASHRRRPVAHSTAGDGRRATPGRLRPLVRAPRPQQPGRVHPGDTRSGDIDRRAAEAAGRRNARLRPGGLGRRRGPVLAPRGDCPPVQGR